MTPLKHQQELVNNVKNKKQNKVLLWWGMGSGKTAGAFFLAKEWKDPVKLVVCPKSLVGMWKEFLLAETNDNVTDLTKSKYKIAGPQLKNGKCIPGWYIINYDRLQSAFWLGNFKDFTLILDESSFVKHITAKRTKIALRLCDKSRHLALLSGTPCGGKWEDMWTHTQMLGGKSKQSEFLDYYCNRIEIRVNNRKIKIINKSNPYKNIAQLYTALESHGMYKVETQDCIDLPSSREIDIKVDSSKAYKTFDDKGAVSVGDAEFAASSVPATRMALRRLASSYNDEKIDAVSDLLNSTDDRVIIFHQFQEDAVRLEELCKKLQKPYAIQNGQRHDLEKSGSNYDKYNNCVCIVQWQSGGYGLNLQLANVGVYFSLPDSYEAFAQAKARILRNGQRKVVTYYNITAKDSIDEKIKEALDKKSSYTDEKFIEDYSRYKDLPKKDSKIEVNITEKVENNQLMFDFA